MCTLLFAYRHHPGYALVMAANRDEFYSRPTQQAHWWPGGVVLAGMDLQAGGTWMGISRTGRFAALTNHRNPHDIRPDAPSRGALVSQFLHTDQPALDYLHDILPTAMAYNGFNLLVYDGKELAYLGNREAVVQPRVLAPGLYGLSNAVLDTPWPKVADGKERLHQLLATNPAPTPHALIELMQQRELAPDHRLPSTGVSLEWERMLSATFITSAVYGTVCSTAVLITDDGQVHYSERSTHPQHPDRGQVDFAFVP